MENLIFSLNATMPIFFTMLLGKLFYEMKLFDDHFVKKMNTFVFQVALPAAVFKDLYTIDFASVWDTKYVLFCFTATLLSIGITFLLSFLWKDRSIQGEFVQASYRSSAAILGIAFIENIYGNSGMAPLMIIGTVPLYNIMAVVILSFLKPGERKIDSALLKKTAFGVLTNPIIIGIFLGMLWSIVKIPVPKMFAKTLQNISALSSPMGLMAMGASFRFENSRSKWKPACTAAFIKLIGLCSIFLPVAIALGFRDQKLVAVLVMLGSATTVTSFVMSKNMGHEGVLSSFTVMLTTLFSAFTLTAWLFLVKSLGLV